MTISKTIVAIATLVAISQAVTADAAFDKAEQKCRATIAKAGSKLAGTVSKVITGCHKSRDIGKIAPATNCNLIAEADTKGLVAKSETKLADSVGGAKDACAGLTPSALSYESCPAPCAGAITTFSDVASCITCLVETEVVASTSDALGNPTPPLGSIETKCRTAISKSHSKHLSAVLKGRTKCQGLAEKGGATDPYSCGGIVDSKIDSSFDKGIESITLACDPADLTGVDSCSTVSSNAVANCVMNDAADSGELVFLDFYGADPVPALTWTQISTTFSATCAGNSCHDPGNQGGQTSVTNSHLSYLELVNAPVECMPSPAGYSVRVMPGSAAQSFLVNKLDTDSGAGHNPACGSSMPFIAVPLDPAFRAGVRAWINSGAPEN